MTRNTKPTALIAEDEPMLRAQLRARLVQAWPELEVLAEAENGEQALALQRELEPDIAFLDIRMPVRSGLEVAQEIADACHVVFVTAYDEYAVTAFEQGAVDYVLKPVTPERMVKVVERLKQRLDHPPADLATVLTQLEARDSNGPLRWIMPAPIVHGQKRASASLPRDLPGQIHEIARRSGCDTKNDRPPASAV